MFESLSASVEGLFYFTVNSSIPHVVLDTSAYGWNSN